jgi:NADPH-dependent 2,4-dienoyl-CoA reductase/sulfur reductase-like enzyme
MHYAIIGNGVAGVTAALRLRERDPRAEITIVSGESDYFFSRTALMYAYMDKMDLPALEPFERKVYKKQSLRLVKDWVTDLDAGARKLRLQSGGALTYDKLLLATGSVANPVTWPGMENVKDGVVNFVSLQDLQSCERLTPSTRHAVVVGGGLIGIELVECLRHHGVGVTFLVREPWYWPVALDQQEAGMIAAHIRENGVDLRIQEEIARVEAGPGGRIAAIETKAGERIECQMLGVTAGVRPNIDWLRKVATPPELGRGIVTDTGFATSLPGVYAAGDCAQIGSLIEQIWYSAKRHGELAAKAMLGDPVDYKPPIFFNSSKFFEIEFTTVGEVIKAPAEARHFFHQLTGKHVSIRVVSHNGAVIGFNMLGSRWNHNVLERWIAERKTPGEVVPLLHLAQFDVEFGRADLSGVKAAWRKENPNG